MSADNGIYILETCTSDGGKEFRVAESSESWIRHALYNDKQLRAIFGKSNIFGSETEALDEAERIEKEILDSDCPVIEYGTELIRLDRQFPT